jgi:hypothetical protein
MEKAADAIRLIVPVHSDAVRANVGWVRTEAFRETWNRRERALAGRINGAALPVSGVSLIYVDIWATDAAEITAAEQQWRKKAGELLLRVCVDGNAMAKLPNAETQASTIEIAVLEAMLLFARRYKLDLAPFVALLEECAARAGSIDRARMGLPAIDAREEPVPPPVRRRRARAPKRIRISHDDHHARHVGRTADARQFFLTHPFVPATDGHAGREFLALYLFDAQGALIEARIDDLGTRADLDADRVSRLTEKHLSSLGSVDYRGIRVAPFKVMKFGVVFGLIACEPERDDDQWCVIVEPGDYMAFYPPWNGEYDT